MEHDSSWQKYKSSFFLPHSYPVERESSIIFSMPDSVPWDEELRVQAAGGGGGGGGGDGKRGREKEAAGQSSRKGKQVVCECFYKIICDQAMFLMKLLDPRMYIYQVNLASVSQGGGGSGHAAPAHPPSRPLMHEPSTDDR